jgi:hypothetical protein
MSRIVIIPKPLDHWALAQPFQAAIEVVTHVAKWLAKSLADFSQFQAFKIEQLQCSPLYGGQLFKSTPQVREVKPYTDLVLDVGLPY